MAFCDECGEPMTSNANFCAKCGSRVSGDDSAAASSPSASVLRPATSFSTDPQGASALSVSGRRSSTMKAAFIVTAVMLLIILAVLVRRSTPAREGGDITGATSGIPRTLGVTSPGKLTAEMAQRAVDAWRGGNAPVRVLGVAEEPSQNSATADLEFSRDFRIRDAIFGETFADGPGTATFKHYTDGRWVMTSISCQGKHDSSGTVLLGDSWNTNVEVR